MEEMANVHSKLLSPAHSLHSLAQSYFCALVCTSQSVCLPLCIFTLQSDFRMDFYRGCDVSLYTIYNGIIATVRCIRSRPAIIDFNKSINEIAAAKMAIFILNAFVENVQCKTIAPMPKCNEIIINISSFVGTQVTKMGYYK